MIRLRVVDPFNFRASQQHKLVCGSTTLLVDPAVSIVFVAPLLVSVLLQCQLLPAQVAERALVYHHGKLSSSPAILQCSVSDRIFSLRHGADVPLPVWAVMMLESYLHSKLS